jgi:hypothetical protein
LQRVTKVGTATDDHLTNSCWFRYFIIISSDILKVSLYCNFYKHCSFICFCANNCSIYYSYQPVPQAKHLEHLKQEIHKALHFLIELNVKQTEAEFIVVLRLSVVLLEHFK